jgi:hypothetical protein
VTRLRRALPFALAVTAAWLLPRYLSGLDAAAWYEGEPKLQRALAEEVVAFEARDDATRSGKTDAARRFAGEWALVTHQMTALGLAQLCLAHPEWKTRYAAVVTRAALKAFLPEMRDFGTRAWEGEDVLRSLDGAHGHAYMAYPALAVGVARIIDPAFPAEVARRHDALIAAYERRLRASPTGLIETFPGEAYPTDVAAVAAAIAVHGRVTGKDHGAVLAHWARNVRRVQIDPVSRLVHQRMRARTGEPVDAPRGSGTGLAAYFAGFVDRSLAEELTRALLTQEATFAGFGAIREYAPGHHGRGDIDSGPVVLGVSASATGFALAATRAHGYRHAYTRIYRTAALFGMPFADGDRMRFATGGPIGNALLLALLTSGPEVVP